ncbi:hypothetical protein EIP91_011812 [Steccherinum ochraceum]|uniref:Uncharacterized protein n=1 Tax=Steccherinum ochraceum TaxID=92696 RepID=A0A4R0RVP2_9APHY|nr:hypothetical protein EIP91_011812 [Steccherinum ochraceum]
MSSDGEHTCRSALASHTHHEVDRRGHRERIPSEPKSPYTCTRAKRVPHRASKTIEVPGASRESRDQALRKNASDFTKALKSVAIDVLELDSDLVAFMFCARFSSLKHSSNAPMFWATSLGRSLLEREGIQDPKDHFTELAKRLYYERFPSPVSAGCGTSVAGPVTIDTESETELTLELLKIRIAEQSVEIKSLKDRLQDRSTGHAMGSSSAISGLDDAQFIIGVGSDFHLDETISSLWAELHNDSFNTLNFDGAIWTTFMSLIGAPKCSGRVRIPTVANTALPVAVHKESNWLLRTWTRVWHSSSDFNV